MDCETDFTDEVKKGEDDMPMSVGWPCRRCTLINLNDNDRCVICETPRKDNVPKSLPQRFIDNALLSIQNLVGVGDTPEMAEVQQEKGDLNLFAHCITIILRQMNLL